MCEIRDIACSVGVKLATCKEEFLDLTEVEDCCGFYLLRRKYVIRPTLREYINIAEENSKPEEVFSILSKNPKYAIGDITERYPRAIRKSLKWHEKYLKEAIRSKLWSFLEKVKK